VKSNIASTETISMCLVMGVVLKNARNWSPVRIPWNWIN